MKTVNKKKRFPRMTTVLLLVSACTPINSGLSVTGSQPELRAFRNLIIRFRNPDENVSASATFINASVDRVTPEEYAEYYTVRSGDILGSIAQDVNVPVERLIEPNDLIDANVVFPGQMLCTAFK